MDNILIMDKLEEMEKNSNSYQLALDGNIANINNNIQNIPNMVISGIADNSTILLSRVTNTDDKIWYTFNKDNKVLLNNIFYIPYTGQYKIHIDAGSNESNNTYLKIYKVIYGIIPEFKNGTLYGSNIQYLADTNKEILKIQLSNYSSNWRNKFTNITHTCFLEGNNYYKLADESYGFFTNLTISSNIYPTNDYSLLFYSN